MDINLLASIIISKLETELKTSLSYDLNVPLGNYGDDKLEVLLVQLRKLAEEKKIELDIKIDDLLILEKELDIHASYVDNMFVRFMVMESYFYNLLKHSPDLVFQFEEKRLGRLYALNALKTAQYQVGNDSFIVDVSGKKFELESSNMTLSYQNDVIPIDVGRWFFEIEKGRTSNLSKKLIRK